MMTTVLVSSTIGLGIGIIVALLMDPYKPIHGVYMALAIVILFAGIGWGISRIEGEPPCPEPQVRVTTPNVKGCMMPDEVAALDPEVLGR